MLNKVMKLAASSVIALGLVSAPVLAQEVSEWDGDGDGALSEEEFGTGFGETNAFGNWDANADEQIDEEEFGAGLGGEAEEGAFTEADADGDGGLNEEELGGGVFSNYDEDESGALEEGEASAFGGDAEEGGWFE